MAEESAVSHAMERQRMSRKEFEAAHEEGMSALKRHDLASFAKAIEKEAAAMEKHSQTVDGLNSALRSAVRETNSKRSSVAGPANPSPAPDFLRDLVLTQADEL
jgi:hypothetical protein